MFQENDKGPSNNGEDLLAITLYTTSEKVPWLNIFILAQNYNVSSSQTP